MSHLATIRPLCVSADNGKADKSFIIMEPHWAEQRRRRACSLNTTHLSLTHNRPRVLSRRMWTVLMMLKRRALDPLLYYCFLTYFFVSNEHLQIYTMHQKHTHTFTNRDKCYLPLIEGLASSPPASCQSVPVSVSDEWSWKESYLIWETHLVSSVLFLSSKHPRRSPISLYAVLLSS